MNSKFLVLIMASTLLIPFASTAVAQPEPTLGNWELGINYPMDDDSEPFEVGTSGAVLVTFWIHNQGLFPIKVGLEYEAPWEADSAGDEEKEIEADKNISFTLVFSNIDVFEIAAKSKEPFQITANLQERNSMPVIIPESQEATGDLEIPEIFELKVEITEPAGPMNSGTDSLLKITVTNEGNSQDRAREVEVTDDCPLMTTDEGLEGLTSRNIQPGESTSADLKITASESHPTRNCRIEVTVASNGADGAQLSSDFVRVTVESAPSPDNSDNNGDDDDTQSPTEVVSSNLPAPGLSIIFSALIGALLIRDSKRI